MDTKNQLTEIFDWTRKNVWSSFFVCWGAQAALYHFHQVPKYQLPEKRFGVYLHRVLKPNSMLMRGFDDEFWVPVSRHTETRREDIEKIPALEVLSESSVSGLYIVKNRDQRQLFVFNHSEYEVNTLKQEYERDISQQLSTNIPVNYFPDDDPGKPPMIRWRGHAHLLFSNWLNYHVYQTTPFLLDDI